jgi:hypothetical protein
MKNLLFIFSLFCAFTAQAQIPVQYIGTNNNRVITRGQFRADSAIGLPTVKQTTNLMQGSLKYTTSFKGLEVYDTTTQQWYPITSIQLRDGVISGGNVSWTGTGLQFYVSESVYMIGGVLYFGNDTTVTLSAADGTNPRQDVIGLNNIGVYVLTGTPAADPAKPQVTPGFELELTSILVAAGATNPTLTQEVIYDENTEWTVTTSNLTANADNTLFPYRLTKSIDIDAYAASTGRSLIFTKGSLVDMTQYSLLTLYVRLNSDYAADATINVQFTRPSGIFTLASSSVVTISTGNYNFVRTIDGAYQTIQIPLSAFTFTSFGFSPTQLNRLTLTFNGAADGLYVDYINLQGGITIPSAGVTTFNNRGGNVTSIKDDYDQWFIDTTYRRADSVFAMKNGTELFQYKDSVGGGGGGSYTFTNGVKEAAGTVTAGGYFETDSISYISNSNKTFRIQSRLAAGTTFMSDWWQNRSIIAGQVIGSNASTYGRVDINSTGINNGVFSSLTPSGYGSTFLNVNAFQAAVYNGTVGRMLKVSPTVIYFMRENGTTPSNEFFADSSKHNVRQVYGDNYRSLFTPFTLVDKGYVDSLAGTISGSTVLNNVGTGYDVAVQGTDNVKRLQAGFGIKIDSATSNVVKISLDTTTQTLTDGATITFDANAGVSAKVTLGGNRTLAFSNFSAGVYLTLVVIQDGTGGRTLTLPTCKVINGGAGAVTLTTAAASEDILTFFKVGTTIYCNYGKNYN